MSDLRHILVIDIETASLSPVYSMLEPRLQAEWAKKAVYLKNDENLTPEDLFNSRAGIYAEFGKIICIGVGYFNKNDQGILNLRIKAIYGDDEKAILLEFKELLEKRFDKEKTSLCAHNGKEFDYPYLCRRFLVNGIPLPSILDISSKKPWEINHIDTMDLWKFGDRKSYTSLELLATIFGLETSKKDMDGSMVNKVYYEEKNLEKIKEYCLQDVIVTANLYLKLNTKPEIRPENVVRA
jgi:hypothetical protein